MELADGSCVQFTGLSDRERKLPPPAGQAALDSMNCFKTDPDGVLMECTGNICRLRHAAKSRTVGSILPSGQQGL